MSSYDSIAAVVLAAGESSRMNGRVKQLLPWGEEPLLRHAIEQTLEAGFSHVFVVLGYRADLISPAINDLPVDVIVNDRWSEGVASSVRAAVEAFPGSIKAAIFVPSDQPGITAELLRRMADAYVNTGRHVIYATYGGMRGQPVLFDRSLFPELLGLQGDVGGRAVLRRHPDEAMAVEVEDELAGVDIDTWQDYVRLLREYGLPLPEEG